MKSSYFSKDLGNISSTPLKQSTVSVFHLSEAFPSLFVLWVNIPLLLWTDDLLASVTRATCVKQITYFYVIHARE
jgi:hypothetical protein